MCCNGWLLSCHVANHSLGDITLERVKITQQPEATPGVEGQQLVLECRATGVPKPNFLWFKEPDTPLPDHTSDSLIIKRLSKGDSGRYCCRAENEVNTVFSPWVEVKVQKPYILNNGRMNIVCMMWNSMPSLYGMLYVYKQLVYIQEIALQDATQLTFGWKINSRMTAMYCISIFARSSFLSLCCAYDAERSTSVSELRSVTHFAAVLIVTVSHRTFSGQFSPLSDQTNTCSNLGNAYFLESLSEHFR